MSSALWVQNVITLTFNVGANLELEDRNVTDVKHHFGDFPTLSKERMVACVSE